MVIMMYRGQGYGVVYLSRIVVIVSSSSSHLSWASVIGSVMSPDRRLPSNRLSSSAVTYMVGWVGGC